MKGCLFVVTLMALLIAIFYEHDYFNVRPFFVMLAIALCGWWAWWLLTRGIPSDADKPLE